MNKKTTAKNILLLQKLVLLGLCVGIVIFLICISIYRPWKYNGLKTTVGYGLNEHQVVPNDFFEYCDNEVLYHPYNLHMISERRAYLISKSIKYGLYGLLGVFIIGILFLYIIPAQKRLNAIGKG